MESSRATTKDAIASPSSIFDALYPLHAPSRRRPSDRRMQVLCLGLSRSGTDSLRVALTMLGYGDVYHGFVITARQREDCAFWVPLMRRKLLASNYGGDQRPKPLPQSSSIDFDSVLGPSEAVTDGPANVFGEELMDAYPDAKVVLNRRRDVDAWHASMRKTCLQVFNAPMWLLACFDTRIYWLWQNFDLVMRGYYHDDFDKYGRKVAAEHYRGLEKALDDRGREYLDWSVEDGWEPLCKFLGKPVPSVPFPDGNRGGGQFEQNMEEATKDFVMNSLQNMGIFTLSIAALTAGLYFVRQP